MKKLVQIILPVSLLFPVSVSITYAQQMASIAQLKQQIRQFEMVARDAGTPHEVKSINQGFLTERRAQLRTLLKYQIASLKNYQISYQSHFSARERQVVANSIRSLELEIGNLEESTSTRDVLSDPRRRPTTLPGRPTSAAGSLRGNTIPALLPQTQISVIRNTPTKFTRPDPAGAPDRYAAPDTYAALDMPNAVIFNSADASKIIKEAIRKKVLTVPPPYYVRPQVGKPADSGHFSDDFYCVIHVLRWSAPSSTKDATGADTEAQTVAAQNWYVFNNGKGKGSGSGRKWSNEDFTSLNRIFGVKKVWLLYIHLNSIPEYRYDQARYDFNIEKKAPQNISNLFSVAQLFITFPAVAAFVGLSPAQNLWGGDAVDLDYVPSNITITAHIVKDAVSGPVVALDKPKKFNNEGRYWWDVSVALPVRKISQTQFDTTANTVTAKEVDTQNAFALLNLYPVPVDLNGSNYSWIPHFVGGVAIAKQPLKKFLLGAGFGPHFANFYVGAVFTEEKKPATLQEGDPATSEQLNADLKKHFKPKFSFGFNLPVRGVIKSLNKESK